MGDVSEECRGENSPVDGTEGDLNVATKMYKLPCCGLNTHRQSQSLARPLKPQGIIQFC